MHFFWFFWLNFCTFTRFFVIKKMTMKNFCRNFLNLFIAATSLVAVSCSTIDLSGINSQLEQLEKRVKALEEKVGVINTDLNSLQLVVSAIQSHLYISSVTQSGNSTVIVFSNGVSTTISSQEAPLIGIKEVDGIYYWTLNGDFILDKDGNKLPVSGEAKAPVMGVKEVDGVLYWTVNGEFMLDENGNKVPASYSAPSTECPIFSSVTVSAGSVSFVLADGTEFTIPLAQSAELVLTPTTVYFKAGEQKSVKITTKNITGVTITEKPEGWRAQIKDQNLVVTAPEEGKGDEDGYVVVLATSGSQTFIGKVYVSMQHQSPSTYNFTADVTGVDKAKITVSMDGQDFYAGIMLYVNDSEIPAKTAMFLEDAAAPLSEIGDGMYGQVINSYSGDIKLFVAPSDGSGSVSERFIIPGGKYLIALIPKDPTRDYEDYTLSDVIIEKVILKTPQPTSSQLCTVKPGETSTTVAHAVFSVTSTTSKFFYTVVKASTFEKSGMTEYDYAMNYGIKWDRAIVKASGAVDGFDAYENNLAPGTECLAIGIAFNSSGSYYMTSITVSSDQIEPSSGSLSISGVDKEQLNPNSVRVSFNYEASSNISNIRYFVVQASSYGGSDQDAYLTLAAGSRWDYEEITPGDSMTLYIYPEDGDYLLYAVGIDNQKRYTELVKYTFQVK